MSEWYDFFRAMHMSAPEWIAASSVMILVVALVRWALRDRISPRLRYALWLLVLVRLLVSVNVTSSAVSIQNVVERAETQVRARVETTDPVLTYVGGDVPDLAVPERGDLTPMEYQQAVDRWQAEADAVKAETGRAVRLSDVLLPLWAIGAVVTAAVLLGVNGKFYVNLRRRRQRLGEYRDLPVYTAEGLFSPCLVGLFRPAIYLTPEQAQFAVTRTHILAHEYTHYRQGDHIWSYLRCLCLAIHWFNPLVWWAAAASRRDCELSCDAGAVKLLGEEQRSDYGRTLVSIVAQGGGAGNLLRCATTMSGKKSAVRERVAVLAKNPRTRAATLGLVLALALLLAVCTFTGAAAKLTTEDVFPEAGVEALLEAAEAGTYFDVSLSRGTAGDYQLVDTYQVSDPDAVRELTEGMRRCRWTYLGQDISLAEDWEGYALMVAADGSGFNFCENGLVEYSTYEDGEPVLSFYRAELPADPAGEKVSAFDLFFQFYTETSKNAAGTPAPEYGFTTMSDRQDFTDEDGTLLAYCELELPKLYVRNEDVLTGAALTAARQAADTFNREMEQRMEAHRALAKEHVQYAEDDRANGLDAGLPYYVAVSSGVNVQGQIVSASMLVEDNSGGVHPNYGYNSALFDLGAGRFISAVDVGADPDGFRDGAAELLIACGEGRDEDFRTGAFPDWRDTVRNWPETGSACFMDDGLHVYFDPYVLGPYALGGVELQVGYAEIADLLGPGGMAKLGLTGATLAPQDVQNAAPGAVEPDAAGSETTPAPQEPTPTPQEPPAVSRSPMADAYVSILELAFSGKQSEYDYYDWRITDAEILAENSFAVYDIDGDGRKELIINYSGYSTASMKLWVYDYDPAAGEVRLELVEFPSTLFYNNGYVMSYTSHNQGRAAMKDFWPYHLYRYAPGTDTYVEIAIVDGWYREQNEVYGGQHFPADADIDGDGMVYYITQAWEYDDPIDGDAYQQWVDSWQSGATRIEIPFQSLTLENIHNIR